MITDSVQVEELDESALTDALAPLPVDYNDLTEEVWADLVKLKNPHLDNKTFNPLKKEKEIHKKCFLYWLQLADSERTDRNVASKFNLTGAAIGKIRRSFNWEVRLEHFLKDSQKNIELAKSNSFMDTVFSILGVADVGMKQFLIKLKLGEVDVNIKDFISLAKLTIELRQLALELGGDSGESATAADKLTRVLKDMDPKLQSFLVNNLNVTVVGEQPLPHDVLIESEVGQEVQEVITLNEIGEDSESFDYLESDYD